MNEEIKQESKEVGIKFLEDVLKMIGIAVFSLYLMFRPLIQGIFTILIGGLGLYIFLGIIGVVLCYILSALGHAFLGH